MKNLVIDNFKKAIRSNEIGRKILFNYKKAASKIHIPDYEFPELISIEIVSACNLACVHCPPHMKEFKNEVRKFGIIDMELFHKIMDELDSKGVRRIALHKDGEPLMHPKILEILRRVKKNHNHIIYLTTNAHKLDESIANSILENKVNVINFSVGAATEEFYSIVRGKNFNLVKNNILRFLELRENCNWRPRVILQIIDLPEYEEMKSEIQTFKKFWSEFDVEIQVWEKLTWGVYDYKDSSKERYPCYSLWESFTINSDGLVSACCMDWKQELITGDIKENSIEEIWGGEKLKLLRKMHVEQKENELPLCATCNYWHWQNRLPNYQI